jgi:NodT family efflux transporter outer membrane factor (OMF) lipoprotein
MPSKYVQDQNEQKEAAALKNWWENFQDPLLNQLVTTAISGNFDLQIALDRIRQARAIFFIDRANLFPEVDLNAEQQRFRISQGIFEAPFLGPVYQNFYRFGFDASWEIDFFGRLRRAKESSFYELQAKGQNFRDIYISTISEAVRFYVEIRALQQLIQLTEERIAIEQNILELTGSLFNAGLESQRAVDQIKASLASLQASLPSLQSDLNQNIFALAVVLGQYPESVADLFSEDGSIPYLSSIKAIGVPCQLLRRRPDVRRAERELAAATAEIGVAVADLFPTISLTGAYAFESSKIQRWFQSASRTWNIGPFLNWPILDFGRIRNNIRSKKAARDEVFHSYMQTILSAVSDVESALVAYQEEKKKGSRILTEARSLESAMDLNLDLFQAGLVDFQTFLNSEKSYIEARERLIDSRKQEMLNIVAVYKAVGGDW